MSPRASIVKAAVRERLTYDLGGLRPLIAAGAYAAARALIATPAPSQQARGFGLMMRLHSGAFSAAVDRRIIDTIRVNMEAERHGTVTGLRRLFAATASGAAQTFRAGANPNPKRLIGSRMLVIKSPRPRERGVLVVDYSYVFPLMQGLFDLRAIADRYAIVLEPSWAGSCAPEILLFSQLERPVFIETIEPRDQDLVQTLGSNLRTIPIAANWWADPRHDAAAAPMGEDRDIDVAMVAAWADIKRHWRVFRTLGELRKRGHRLKTVLVGYRYDRTKAEIEQLAEHFGVRDQVEAYERISQREVAALLRRTKVHLLWSRRECANRAIVEAMMADVPVIVRNGMTFGFKYPYINDQTGRFVDEDDLADALLDMIAHRDRFAPRQWVMEHMTCHKATAVLEEHVRQAALADGEAWTEGLALKTSALDSQAYYSPADRERFAADYAFLESALR